MAPRAIGPKTSGSTGTSRHPTNSNSFALQTASIFCFTAFRFSSSRGRKIIPTPGLGFSSERNSGNRSHGIWVITPAPSPETPSPPQAPRCSMQVSADRPSVTTLCVPNSPPSLVLAMKPTPQASRSFVNAIGPSKILLGLSDVKAMFSCVKEHCSSWYQEATPPAFWMRPGFRSDVCVGFVLSDCGRNANVTTGAKSPKRQT
mmetsp:Transcript_130479/g.365053  ORF Transcript_130479/g.365053 Transcript_130479/m.365053 type:complete len:203 (+) Transcript_130479:2863-3471(+)